MKIEILKSAKEDLKEGFYFYDNQQKGLGSYFLDSISADIESLRIYAGVHGLHFETYHRLIASKFPFAIYYRIAGEKIRIYAVIDCRRDPAWIRSRLQ